MTQLAFTLLESPVSWFCRPKSHTTWEGPVGTRALTLYLDTYLFGWMCAPSTLSIPPLPLWETSLRFIKWSKTFGKWVEVRMSAPPNKIGCNHIIATCYFQELPLGQFPGDLESICSSKTAPDMAMKDIKHYFPYSCSKYCPEIPTHVQAFTSHFQVDAKKGISGLV